MAANLHCKHLLWLLSAHQLLMKNQLQHTWIFFSYGQTSQHTVETSGSLTSADAGERKRKKKKCRPYATVHGAVSLRKGHFTCHSSSHNTRQAPLIKEAEAVRLRSVLVMDWSVRSHYCIALTSVHMSSHLFINLFSEHCVLKNKQNRLYVDVQQKTPMCLQWDNAI